MEGNLFSYIGKKKSEFQIQLEGLELLLFLAPHLPPKSQISNARLDFIWNTYIGSWFGIATSGHFSQKKLNFVIR